MSKNDKKQVNDDIILKKKQKNIKDNKKNKVIQKRKEQRKKVSIKKQNKLTRKEKTFLFLNILIILGLIGFYGYRVYYYYHLTHDEVKSITMKDKLTSLNNIEYHKDGLYEKEGYFYYKGVDVDNYVYYSGRMFRIIDISNGIRMIEDDTETNLIWSIDSDYQNSVIHSWLNNYLDTLNDYDLYLTKNNWCNERIDVSNYNCQNMINDYVGLLNINDYLQAGGLNSYLNNKTYFWTINQDLDGKALYINSEGNINNITSLENNYYSYGIRPVITLREDVPIISGSGKKTEPFIIEELGRALLKDNSVGSYVTYNNKLYRILNIEEDGVSLIYEGIIELNKNYNDVEKYINNEYLNDINKKDLVKQKVFLGQYNIDNKYNYEDKKEVKKEYVRLPNIGELFLNNYNDYWLNNVANNKLGLMYTIDNNKMFYSDLKNNSHYIRPIIKLNNEMVVTSGIGLIADPLIIGEEGDNNE